jgi:hypothetical protein
MQVEKTQYTTKPVSNQVGMVGLTLLIGVPGILAWALTSDATVAVLIGIGGLAVAAVIGAVARHRNSNRSFTEAKMHLLANGFETDFELPRQFAIDSSQKKIAFVSPATMTYEIYDMNDILGCEHQWVNTSGTGGRIEREKNTLVFKTRNPKQPQYKFMILSHSQAELWLARINALLNS